MNDNKKGARPAPLSLRLSRAERSRLEHAARGAPLGTYIKCRIFSDDPAPQGRRHLPVRDQRALAKALALLGQGELSASLRHLAEAVRSGSLECDDEVASMLAAGCADIREIRVMLVSALGLKAEAPPHAPSSTPRRAFSRMANRDVA